MKLLIFIFIFCLQSPIALGENISRWKLGLYGTSTDDTLSTSKVVGLFGAIEKKHELSDSLFIELKINGHLETGTSSALFTDEFSPNNGFTLKAANFEWRMFRQSTLKLGAIEQNQSPILISQHTFPAAEITLEEKIKNWKINVGAEAAIPTGTNFKQKSVGKERTPLFYSQKIGLQFEKNENETDISINHFDFRNLTHGIAQDSRFYGNTISGVSTGSQFYYQYDGFQLSIKQKNFHH